MVELLETVSGDWGLSRERSRLALLNWRRCDDRMGGRVGPGPVAGALRDDMRADHQGGMGGY